MTMASNFIRKLWSLLPRGPRRWLFVTASAIGLRPLPDPGVARPPVTVAGVFRSASGLGESARLNLAALRDAGIACHGADLSHTLLGSLDLDGTPFPAASAGPGTLILHVSGPFVPYALRMLGTSMTADKHIIGVWHWELPRLPAEWRAGCAYVHEVWAPSQFVADAVRQEFHGRVRVIPHAVTIPDGLDPAPWRAQVGERFLAVTHFNMASGFERKNPLAAVAAFRRAFGDDSGVCLIIKMLNAQVWPQGERRLRAAIGDASNIRIVTQVMARHEVFSLLAAADVVLSLHRAEGFGLLAAEAMLLGKPVIATDWSATTDFVTPQNACPVSYQLIPARDPQGHYHYPDQCWAEPDCDDAARWLRLLRDDPKLRQFLGDQAKADASHFSTQAYHAHMRRIIGDSV
jgi:glycosyltransferase involved in cell wall biosynthesis